MILKALPLAGKGFEVTPYEPGFANHTGLPSLSGEKTARRASKVGDERASPKRKGRETRGMELFGEPNGQRNNTFRKTELHKVVNHHQEQGEERRPPQQSPASRCRNEDALAPHPMKNRRLVPPAYMTDTPLPSCATPFPLNRDTPRNFGPHTPPRTRTTRRRWRSHA